MTSAAGLGLATVTGDGTVLDTWFPEPELGAYSPAGTTRQAAADVRGELAALAGPMLVLYFIAAGIGLIAQRRSRAASAPAAT